MPPDYHVVIEGVAYSVPFRLIGKTVDVHRTASLVSIVHNATRVELKASLSAKPAPTPSRPRRSWLYSTTSGQGTP